MIAEWFRDAEGPLATRIAGAMQAGPASGTADLAGLIGHLLRCDPGRAETVPRAPGFPDRATWERFGVSILTERPEHFVICANPWRPAWLESQEVGRAAFREEGRRTYSPAFGDPFLAMVGRTQYLSEAQRQAVRAVLTGEPGGTWIVNLPTGTGKSLVAQLPILLEPAPALGVIVVPTTALAIDQELALAPFISHASAYYSGMDASLNERREALRTRIRQGEQRLVLTSPEALRDSLSGAIYTAARKGHLRYFVIDEAHLVDSWGDEFRPAFQELAGLRRDLLRAALEAGHRPFTTLLLSATISPACRDTLELFFGSSRMLSAVQLRPEPEFWFCPCPNQEVRSARLLEAIRLAPRPLVLYTTRVRDAEAWYGRLLEEGFRRLRLMTGSTGTSERVELMERWRAREVDIVVATSAFGLGIDQSDVRTVLHACVPETLDRFYQEVGRGGRDGSASLSLSLFTRADLETARGMNQTVLIGVDRGHERWSRMFHHKAREAVGDNLYRVPLTATPAKSSKDLDMQSDANVAWNIRTLNLMTRAGLIALEAEAPPMASEDLLDEAYQELFRKRANTRVVRILDDRHMEPETWLQAVEPRRAARRQADEEQVRLMEEVAGKPVRCVAEAFAQLYRMPDVPVALCCGGCPYCRSQSSGMYAEAVPFVEIPSIANVQVRQPFLSRLGGNKSLVLLVREETRRRGWKGLLSRFLSRVIRHGFIYLLADEPELESIELAALAGPGRVLLHDRHFHPVLSPKLPAVAMHLARAPLPEVVRRRILDDPRNERDQPWLVLLPDAAPDPNRPGRPLREVLRCSSCDFQDLCEEEAV